MRDWKKDDKKHKIEVPHPPWRHTCEHVQAWLNDLYLAYPKLAKRADEVHASRMMTGQACPDCIRMALDELLT